jgi:SAM-dependent methyltransferase
LQRPLPDTQVLEAYYANYASIKADMNPGYLDDKQYQGLKAERTMTLRELGFDLDWISQGQSAELGCASGHFLQFLLEHGAKQPIGLDISTDLAAKAAKLAGVLVHVGGLERLKDQSIDNLFLFNVVEHVPDQAELWGQIDRVLAPHGRVMVEVPLCGMVSTLFGSDWRFLMPDEHLNLPSLKGLRRVGKHFGFSVQGLTRFGSGYTSGMIHSALKRGLDLLAKRGKFGDRGTVLFMKDNQD